MVQTFLFGCLVLILTVLSRVWVETFAFISWGPDLALLVLVYFAAFHNAQRGLVLAFILGLVNDVLTGVHPGLHATIYTVIFWIMSRAGQSFYLRSVLFQLVAAVSATVGYRLIELLILTVFEQPGTVRVELLWAIPAQAAINTAVAPFVFKLLSWIDEIAEPSLMRGGPSPTEYW